MKLLIAILLTLLLFGCASPTIQHELTHSSPWSTMSNAAKDAATVAK